MSNQNIIKKGVELNANLNTNLQEGALQMPGEVFNKPAKAKSIDKEAITKTRILFVTRPIAPPWDEASKNMAYQLAINVARINPDLEIHLMTKGDLRETISNLPLNIIQHPIYTEAENDFTLAQKIRSLWFQWRMKNKFDIVHYFFTPSKLNSFFIKNFLYPKKSKTIQTIATLREDLMNAEEIKKSIFGDILVTYSKYTKKKLKKLGFANTHHIYPGIDLENYRPQEKNLELMKEVGISSNDFVIAFTGEYVRLGGIDEVVKSFLTIKKQIPGAKLLLIVRVKNSKDAEKKKVIISKFEKLNLLNRIIFADELDFSKWSVGDLYNLSDLIIYPIHNMKGKFDVPLVVPESMACEKLNILSTLPLLKEFANHNTAVLIEPKDTRALTEAILEAYKNPDKAGEIAHNGLRYARRNFNIEFIAEEYNALYKELN